MDINPYETSKAGQPLPEDALQDTQSIRALLTEIRDTQRAFLELQREAMQRVRMAMRPGRTLMFLPFSFLLLIFASA